jgi:hypothetical protein
MMWLASCMEFFSTVCAVLRKKYISIPSILYKWNKHRKNSAT